MIYIEREILSALKKSMNEHFYISALIGPRQTGKTTLLNKLKDFLEKEKGISATRIFYFNLDNVDLRSKIKIDFKYIQKDIEANLGSALDSLQTPIYIFIDEAQKSPEIFDLMKIIFDDYQDKVKIFLSGSSSFNIQKHSAETLAGRIRFFYLYPFSLRELINHYIHPLKDSLLQTIINGKYEDSNYLKMQAQIYRDREKIFPIWQQALLFGFLPKIFQLDSSEDKNFYLRDFINTYIEKDIKLLKEVGDIELFSRVLSLFISEDSQLLNITGIANNFGISRITLNKYFSILKETNVLCSIFPFVRQNSKKLIKSSKIFFFDNGFINYESKIFSFEQLLSSKKIGAVFENIIINNALRHTANSSTPPNIYFWRDYDGHEIDLVIEIGDKIIPIEITYSPKITSDKRINFRAFYKSFPKAEDGFIIYTGEHQSINVENKKITAIPFWMWQ